MRVDVQDRVHEAGHGRDQHRDCMTLRIKRRQHQPCRDSQVEGPAVGDQVRVEGPRFRNSRNDSEEPGRGQEKHLDPVGQVYCGEQPKEDGYPARGPVHRDTPLRAAGTMVVGRTCAGSIIAKAVEKPTAGSTSAIRPAAATPAIHKASPSGIAITATSLKTTPMPIRKLRARSLKGQDMGVVSLLAELSAE